MQNFIFRISSYDIEKLLPQVSKALEKRTELVSRERYPGLWKQTDKWNAMSQGKTRSRLRTRILSILCLAVGIFLFVPGLVEPQELLVPLLAGAVAIGAGIGGLVRSSNKKSNRFDKSAALLLKGKDTISAEDAVEVAFTEDGMILPTDQEGCECVSYDSFECAVETADLYLVVYDTRVTVLQKKDLAIGEIAEFRDFLAEKVKNLRFVEQNG